MPIVTAQANQQIFQRLDAIRLEASKIILDKAQEVDLALACLIAGGHLLIEDIPGVGKTTLVKVLAKLLNLKTSRIQFTNDLLPADILGSSIYDPERKTFLFHRGPIFAQLVLADELNRATPKTQSACLQAMEEHRVTVDGVTHDLPDPFFMVATQNPRQQIGTFPLPESQLDRFLMRIAMGYPSREAERKLLLGESRLDLLENMKSIAKPGDILEMRNLANGIHTSENIITYVQNIVAQTREHSKSPKTGNLLSSGSMALGLSPRGGLGLVKAARAWALLQKRAMILPEDIQAVAVAVMSHRLNPTDDISGDTGTRMAEDVIAVVRVD